MKDGIKTTEFWTTIISSVIIATSSHIGLMLDPAAVTGITSMVVAYTLGRVFSKYYNGKLDH